MDQHTGGKWLIHGTNNCMENQLQNLKPPWKRVLYLSYKDELGKERYTYVHSFAVSNYFQNTKLFCLCWEHAMQYPIINYDDFLYALQMI